MKRNSSREAQRWPTCLLGTSDAPVEGRNASTDPKSRGAFCARRVISSTQSTARSRRAQHRSCRVLCRMQTHLSATNQRLPILQYLAQYGHAYNPSRTDKWFLLPKNNICKPVPSPLFQDVEAKTRYTIQMQLHSMERWYHHPASTHCSPLLGP